jgi:hypothetical protein
MTQDQFNTWLNDPRSMDGESISQLREVIKRYPFYSTAQVMLAKNLREENHIDQLKQLQLAAIMTPDRKVFHNYLTGKVITPVEKATQQVEPTESEPIESVEEQSEESRKPQETVEPRFPDELIPEPIVYQLETADLPVLPPKEDSQPQPEPDELSFSEWLEFTASGNLETEESEEEPDSAIETQPHEKRSNIELIDHFLSQSDDLPKKRAEFFNPRKVAAKADQHDFSVVSETLADIYFQQEKYELARQAYEALSLKYPEKSVYFAARLKETEQKLSLE